MAKINYIINNNPTLEAMNKELERQQSLEEKRHYLGASIIGDQCWRKLFYNFRQAEKRSISASGIKAIQDGYLQEEVTLKRLRSLPFLEIYTTEGDDGKQIGFQSLLGHFKKLKFYE